MTSIRSQEVIQQAATTKLVPDRTFVVLFKSGDTTPSVNAVNACKSNNAAITNFDNGVDGQTIKVLGDGVSSVVYGATIKTNTAINKTLEANKVYTFTRFNGVWYEDA